MPTYEVSAFLKTCAVLRTIITLLREFWLPKHFIDDIIVEEAVRAWRVRVLLYPLLSDTDCTSEYTTGLLLLLLLLARCHHTLPPIEDSRSLTLIDWPSQSQGSDHGV